MPNDGLTPGVGIEPLDALALRLIVRYVVEGELHGRLPTRLDQEDASIANVGCHQLGDPSGLVLRPQEGCRAFTAGASEARDTACGTDIITSLQSYLVEHGSC